MKEPQILNEYQISQETQITNEHQILKELQISKETHIMNEPKNLKECQILKELNEDEPKILKDRRISK